MPIFPTSAIPAAAAASSYSIDQSLRFNDDDTAYLSRTPGSASNRKTWTFSCWVKRGNVLGAGDGQKLFAVGANGSAYFEIMFYDFANTNQYSITVLSEDSTTKAQLNTTAKYRDPSSWYHVMLAVDTTQSTSTDRLKLYVNGSQITDFIGVTTYPSLNFDYRINAAQEHNIGRHPRNSGQYYLDGYLAEVHFIDGTALTPTSFGETDADYKHWKPIEVTGLTYGTNGFHLDFANATGFHVPTVVGDAQHSTARSKVGSSSMLFDGNDKLSIPDSPDWDFGTDDFTVEMWTYHTSSADEYPFHLAGASSGAMSMNTYYTSNLHFDLPNGIGAMTASSGTVNSWNHYAIVRNGTTFTAYLNGSSFATITSSASCDSQGILAIGGHHTGTSYAWTGNIDEVRISNVARYTSNFTPSTTAFTTDSNTKLLIHSNTTNGSTTFTDSSTTDAGLGTDAAGSNNWTANNLASTDQMVDSPTNNFATLNSVDFYPTGGSLKEGNLELATTTYSSITATQVMDSGKWYWEVLAKTASANTFIGIRTADNVESITATEAFVHVVNGMAYRTNASIRNNDVDTSYGATYTSGDIISVLYDADNGTLTFWKNGVTQGTAVSSLSGSFVPAVGSGNSTTSSIMNFGQDSSFAGSVTAGTETDDNGYGSFKYDVPTGFLALCTNNLPEPAVKPQENFDVDLWAGTGATNARTIGFQPDFVWIAQRSDARGRTVFDSLRGATVKMDSSSDAAEDTHSDSLVSFDSTGYTLGADTVNHGVNYGSNTHVGWAWKAGGSTGVSNTNGSITSSVSANADAGFSIVSFTGTSANATVGHGLASAPEMVIVKRRDLSTYPWKVYHSGIASDAETDAIALNLTAAADDHPNWWNDTAPTATTFSLGTSANHNSGSMISYCFHSVEGHSKVGSWVGNYSSDGTFVYCGFRPRFILFTASSIAGEHWWLFDVERDTYNVVNHRIAASEVATEYTTVDFMDINSNGFKLRTNSAMANSSGATYIFLAISEIPFKYSTAR